jgi:hypothetical protein
MPKITVYVGDVTEYLSIRAKAEDSGAQLIAADTFDSLSAGTHYISIGDIDTLNKFATVLQQADRIVYAPPLQWSDTKKNLSKMKEWTEDYLVAFADKKIIDGFNFPFPVNKTTMLELIDTRKTKGSQLWVAGCSFTYGVGVEPTERYGQLLANVLQLPVTFLAWPGTSLTWQADQLLRSDIRKDDIVVWGLTAHERFPYFENNKLTHVNSRAYEKDPGLKYKVNIEFLDSQQLIYQAVVEIHQVINFCEKVGARLILAQIHGRGMETYLHGYKNYIMLRHQFGRNAHDVAIDLGSDGEHPGPIMHQWYCDNILKKYQEVYGEHNE